MTARTENTAGAEKFRFNWSDLPAITSELPGTCGEVRTELEDFVVTEIPSYLPCGSGEHVFALVEKRGRTTRDLVSGLKRAGVAEQDIGFAGQKDKYSITRQWISVHERSESSLSSLNELDGVRILEVSRHKNKLRIGHLRGNRFEIRVRNPAEDWERRAQPIVEQIRAAGMPNYFGPQRFGRFNSNIIDGMQLVRGGSVRGDRRMRNFFLSALQSHLFNWILKLRIESGLFDTVVSGDMAQKHDTGGMFLVENGQIESPRAKNFEISATIPLIGKKIRISQGRAGEFEQQALEYFGLQIDDLDMVRGDRRISRVRVDEIDLRPAGDGYFVSFALPKGAFATCFLRELMKTDVDMNPDDDR